MVSAKGMIGNGAVELPNSKQPGQTGIFRHAQATKGLERNNEKNVNTLYENFEYAVKHNAMNPFLGIRDSKGDYVWNTYKQVAESRNYVGSGILHLSEQLGFAGPKAYKKGAAAAADNLGLGNTMALGIYAINRPEWVVAEQICNAYGLASVALYDTLGAETVEFIINHSEISAIVASKVVIPNLLKVAHKCPRLKLIISMDPLVGDASNVLQQWAIDRKVTLKDWKEVEMIGRKNLRKHTPPSPETIACICYTSGTTHMICMVRCMEVAQVQINNEDVHISYLPLAHIFERMVQVAMIHGGARIGFFRGNVLTLVEDIAALKPTIFVSVPRLLNRIYAKIVDGTINAPGLRGMLFRKAVADKLFYLKSNAPETASLTHSFWDRLLFSKVQAILGGRVRLVITASAPIAGEVLDFLRLVFSAEVIEAYGATETCGLGTITNLADYSTGHVGAPFICSEMKLVDVPEMNYFATDKPFPRGEICLRGECIFRGYLKDKKKTEEALDSENWYHTGDIGYISGQGKLTIIDRKKNIFKLAQGEYVAPEKIENAMMNCDLIQQIFVHGDSLQSELVAVVVPFPEKIVAIGKKLGISNVSTFEGLCKVDKVREKVLEEMTTVAKAQKLQGFEIVRSVFLDPIPFSVESGLLTSTMKLKRPQAKDKYTKEIAQMYADLAKAKAATPAKL